MTKTMLVCCSIVLYSIGAQAQTVFKCVGPDKKVSYSAQPCPSSANESRVNVNPNVIATPELQRQAKELERRERSRASKPHADLPPAATPKLAEDKSGSQECKAAVRDYQIETRSVARDEQRLEGKRLGVNIACGTSFESDASKRRARGKDMDCFVVGGSLVDCW